MPYKRLKKDFELLNTFLTLILLLIYNFADAYDSGPAP